METMSGRAPERAHLHLHDLLGKSCKCQDDVADGVIVGSACVKTIGGSEKPAEAAKEFAKSFKGALE